MYKVIGADENEYGPITADQVRQWIAEGRINESTSARLETETTWKPLSSFPEFAEALGSSPLPPPPFSAGTTGVPATTQTLLARDFDLDIGNCLSRAWALLKENFWPMVGVSFLISIIIAGVNQLVGLFTQPAVHAMFIGGRFHFSPGALFIIFGSSVITAPIYTILMGGLFKYFIKMIRGETAGIGDAFSGFSSNAGQLALLGLVSGALSTLGFFLCLIPGIYLYVSWIFAIPLVMDKNLPFWDAMELSRKVVSKHWFIVFAFSLIVGLVSVAGVIACCVGVFVTVALGWTAMMYAYEDIFGR